jgi:sorbitol-specific phosphotransferase system component IIBC
MEDYKFLSILFVKTKLVTAVLCFGSHICNQAGTIRVQLRRYLSPKKRCLVLKVLNSVQQNRYEDILFENIFFSEIKPPQLSVSMTQNSMTLQGKRKMC